jgi:hypothetical protein
MRCESCPHRCHRAWPSVGVLILWGHKARLCPVVTKKVMHRRGRVAAVDQAGSITLRDLYAVMTPREKAWQAQRACAPGISADVPLGVFRRL